MSVLLSCAVSCHVFMKLLHEQIKILMMMMMKHLASGCCDQAIVQCVHVDFVLSRQHHPATRTYSFLDEQRVNQQL